MQKLICLYNIVNIIYTFIYNYININTILSILLLILSFIILTILYSRIMCLRICPKCFTDYKYPSVLTKHLRTSVRCISTEDDIKTYFEQDKLNKDNTTSLNTITNNTITTTTVVNKKIISCNLCDSVFTKTSSLKRHKLESKCGKSQTNNTTSQSVDIVNMLETLTPDLALNFLEFLSNKVKSTTHTNNHIANTNNTNNIHNTTNNNQNNLILNNNIQNNNLIQNTTNNITIQQITPFGFEDVRKIPLPEMKKILKSGLDSGILIIKAIYNQIENKNFYKPNMGKSDIACLNDSFNLSIYKGNQFADVLFDRCITLLHHMLYLCKNELSTIEIQLIYDNIQHIENEMRTEIYDKQLQNIIESEFRNNNVDNKTRISKYIKHIKASPEIKAIATNELTNVKELNNNSRDDLQVSISDKEINDVLGDPKIYFNLSKDKHYYEFQMKPYEETNFYSYWKKRLNDEKEYMLTKDKKTIGDIINMHKREQKITMKIDVVGDRHKWLKHGELIDLDVKSDYYTSKENDDIGNIGSDGGDLANMGDLEGFECDDEY